MLYIITILFNETMIILNYKGKKIITDKLREYRFTDYNNKLRLPRVMIKFLWHL